MRLVLTRPQDDSERSAIALRARGHEVLIAPLMRVEIIAPDLRPHWGAVNDALRGALAGVSLETLSLPRVSSAIGVQA